MRSHDIQVGHAYALARNDRVKVTVLGHKPNGRVLVRFETGVKAGESTLLLSRSIARPWGTKPTHRPFLASSSDLVAAGWGADDDDGEEGRLEVGDVVRLATSETPLEWTVASFETDERVTITTAIFEQQHSRTVSVADLERCRDRRAAPYVVRPAFQPVEPSRAPAISDEEVRENLRPIAPRRELDEILDNVLFTTACVASYGRRYARGISPVDVSERLRDEISRRGFLLRDHPGEYGRIRVLHRFDVVLHHRPSLENPVKIERLRYAGSQRGRPRAAQRDRRRTRRAA